jgi:hypothetical protein
LTASLERGSPRAAEARGRLVPRRRFTEIRAPDPADVRPLAASHPAVAGARTLFPSTVIEASASPRLLVSGANQRKLGDRVVKGAWRGFPIYSLTLEERASCPSSCHNWRSCYGNAMHYARRHRHGAALEQRLAEELRILALRHSGGFVVRLHLLGDFYAERYVERWRDWLFEYPALHAFG